MTQRRSFVKKILSSGVALAGLPLVGISDKYSLRLQELPSLKNRKILFAFGGWSGHSPKKFKDFLVPWLEAQGANVEVTDQQSSYENTSLMQNVDLVIQCITMSTLTSEQESGLLSAIRENGTGMAGWHGGMGDSFRSNPAYQYMVGGQWVAHPGGKRKYTVNISNSKDPISADMQDFEMNSEQYYMHVDPNVKVLATTKFDGRSDSWIQECTMPVAWKKAYGRGRVFYSALGHQLEDISQNDAALNLLQRGIQWSAASKYEPMEAWVSPTY